MSDSESLAAAAARNVVLTALARIISVATPLIFVPLFMWLFSTVSSTDKQVAILNQRVEALEHAQNWPQFGERIAKLEQQNATIISQLERIFNRIERDHSELQPDDLSPRLR
jgi:hypothetical protein